MAIGKSRYKGQLGLVFSGELRIAGFATPFGLTGRLGGSWAGKIQHNKGENKKNEHVSQSRQ